jgi:hypothetical protein
LIAYSEKEKVFQETHDLNFKNSKLLGDGDITKTKDEDLLKYKDNVNLIWADMMKTGSSQSGSVIPSFVAGNPHYIPAGFTLLQLEGLTASDPEAFREGEVFVANTNQNASFHTAIGAAASNAYGEAMVRMPYPLQTNLNQGEIVDKNPEYAIVTLNSDAFEYSVDVNNYYYVTVTFDLDEWGS